MRNVSNYFCIFCDFTCEEYDNAFDHYCCHMFVDGNCEVCDYNKVKIYVDDSYDLCNQCDHSMPEIRLTPEEIQRRIETTKAWINKFLSYQQRVLYTTFANLLLRNQVCYNCPVCRSLVNNYRTNGGEENLIQYDNSNSVQHCYKHLRYDPNDRYLQKIPKLDAFIDHCCDTYFTDTETSVYLQSVQKQDLSDGYSIISTNDCRTPSEYFQSSFELSKTESHDEISSQCFDEILAPCLSKLSLIENELQNANEKLQKVNRELNRLKSELNVTKRRLEISDGRFIANLENVKSLGFMFIIVILTVLFALLSVCVVYKIVVDNMDVRIINNSKILDIAMRELNETRRELNRAKIEIEEKFELTKQLLSALTYRMTESSTALSRGSKRGIIGSFADFIDSLLRAFNVI